MQRTDEHGYGKVAKVYDAVMAATGFRRGIEHFLERIDLKFLPERPKLLDAGCGTGLVARYYAARTSDADIIAFDIDRAMLAEMERLIAEENPAGHAITIARGDLANPRELKNFANGTALPLPENHFDAIFVSAALEHVPLTQTLIELTRLLRPGGTLVTLAMRKNPVGAMLAMMYRAKPYRLANLRAAYESAGLAETRVVRLTPEEFPANLSRIGIIGRKTI